MKVKVFSETLVFIYRDIWRHITGYRIIYYGTHNSSQQDPALSQINPANAISSLRSSLQPEELNICQHRSEKKSCRAYCAYLSSFPNVLSYKGFKRQIHTSICTTFQARSQNCEKRLIVSSFLSVCPSVRKATRLPMDEVFFENLSRIFKFH